MPVVGRRRPAERARQRSLRRAIDRGVIGTLVVNPPRRAAGWGNLPQRCCSGRNDRRVARVIRDLVVRPRSDDPDGRRRSRQRLASAGQARLGAAAVRCPRPRRACRSMLRELGERRRGIPAARRTGPQPGAGAGRAHRQPDQRRDAAHALPESAGGVDGPRDRGPGSPRLPGRAAPDDARRDAHLQPLRERRPLSGALDPVAPQARRQPAHRAAPLQPARRGGGLRAPAARADVPGQPLPSGADRAAADAAVRGHAHVQAAREPRRGRRA